MKIDGGFIDPVKKCLRRRCWKKKTYLFFQEDFQRRGAPPFPVRLKSFLFFFPGRQRKELNFFSKKGGLLDTLGHAICTSPRPRPPPPHIYLDHRN